MALQTQNLAMVGLGIENDRPPNSIQPPLKDGIHLRWAFRQELGFPWHGFYLFRRLHRQSQPICLSQVIPQNVPLGPLPGSTFDTPYGQLTSDRNLVLTDRFPPMGKVEFDLDLRRYIRFTLASGELARRVEVRVGFLQETELQIAALQGRTPVAQAIARGAAGQIVPVTLEFDAISGIEFSSGSAVLIDLCFLPVSQDAKVGWGLVPNFPYPLCLPLTQADYPCSLGLDENLSNARELARQRIHYGETDEFTTPSPPILMTGTVSVVNGSAVVTGVGSNWPEQLPDDAVFQVSGDPTVYTIMTVVAANKLVLSRSYGGSSKIGAAYSIYPDAFGQLHDYLVHLVRGGTAAGSMAYRALPIPVEDAGTIAIAENSAVVTGVGTNWGSELAGLALQIMGDNTGMVSGYDGWPYIGGTGTSWGPELAGLTLQIAGQGREYTILRVISPTLLMLNRNYVGLTEEKAYTIVDKTTYRISRVDSPTQLTLEQNYVGSIVGSGKSYAVVSSLQSTSGTGLIPQMPRQFPLDLILLATVHPAIAQMLGLYWVDQTAETGVAYDYLILADRAGRSRGQPQAVLKEALETDFSEIDGYIVWNQKVAPSTPLAAPKNLKAYALPAPDGQVAGNVGLRWELGVTELGVLLPGRPIVYHLWRADLFDQKPATPPPADQYQPLTKDRPLMVTEPRLPIGKEIQRPSHWPSFSMHAIDGKLPEGWYSYQVSGVDLFGRHSRNSPAIPWYQWEPPPDPLPWYYQGPGNDLINPFAVRLLDKLPPPPPTKIEAYALDPDDPTVLKDATYHQWRDSLSPSERETLIGLRVRWQWTEAHMSQAPDTREFRLYYQPGQLNGRLGRTLGVTHLSGIESEVETDIVNDQPLDAYAGASLRLGADLFLIVGSSGTGEPLRLRVQRGPIHTVGTIAVENGSSIVNGTDTAWSTELTGLTLKVADEPTTYTVLKVESPLQLTLDRNYHGPEEPAERAYTITGKLPRARVPCSLVIHQDYTAGRVAVENGSAIATGTETRWGTELTGRIFQVAGEATEYTITEVNTDMQQLTLDRDYTGIHGDDKSYLIRHPLFKDYSQATNWEQRIYVVNLAEHRQPAADGDGWQYEVFLPAPATGEGESFFPSVSEPVVYAQIGVSAADDKTHTLDEPKWEIGSWGGRFGNEGRIAAPAKIFRVLRKRPDSPIPPPDSERVYATPADYHSHSFYTYRWYAQDHLKTHIFRALDDALFKVDWLIRTTRTALDPTHPKHKLFFPTAWTSSRKQAAANQLNAITSFADYAALSTDAREVLRRLPGNKGVAGDSELAQRDWEIHTSRSSLSLSDRSFFPNEWSDIKRQTVAAELNAIDSFSSYSTLSNDGMRVLAGLPGNERAFTQLTIQPLDPDNPDNANRKTLIDPDDFEIGAPDIPLALKTLRIYIDTLDGRSTNRYFYRAAYVDGAHNLSKLSLSSPPVYLPNVVPPRAPVITKVLGGDRQIILKWASNREPDLAEYRIYRAESEETARDLQLMTLVHSEPMLVAEPSARPAEMSWEDKQVSGLERRYYTIVAVDQVGNISKASAPISAQAFDYKLPDPPIWERIEWVQFDTNDEEHLITGTPPADKTWKQAVALGWFTPEPHQVLVQRKRDGQNKWRRASNWLLPKHYDTKTNQWFYEMHDIDIEPLVDVWYRLIAESPAGNINAEYDERKLNKP